MLGDADYVILVPYLEVPGPDGSTQVAEQNDKARKIINCALKAGITKVQWDEMLLKVGAEKIEDLLDLHAEDFEECRFKPVLCRRIVDFQSLLFEMFWANLGESGDEDSVARGSGDPVPPPPPPIQGTAQLCKEHKPKGNRASRLKYWFFQAVSDGCTNCVGILVNDLGVDKDVRSDTMKYSAKDFATWAEQDEMFAYLEKL